MKKFLTIKTFSIISLLLLLLQYILGLSLNLFSNFDNINIPGNNFGEKTGLAFEYARTSSNIILNLHWINALLLLLCSLIILILAIRQKRKAIWIQSLIMIVLYFIAAQSGAAFLAYNDDNYSFIMGICYILITILAVSIFITSKNIKN